MQQRLGKCSKGWETPRSRRENKEQQGLQGAPGKIPGSKRVRQRAAGGCREHQGNTQEQEGETKSSRALP